MSNVISCRTDKIEALKKLAEAKNTTVSALISEIVSDHVNYFEMVKTRRFITIPREMISFLYNHLDEVKIDEFVSMAVEWVLCDLKTSKSNLDYQTIVDGIKIWFLYNGFEFKRLDTNESDKYVCKHDMGEKWSNITAKIIAEIFNKTNFPTMIIESTKNYFSIKVNPKDF